MYTQLFSTITPLSSYWLGLLAADGNMRKNRYGFSLGLQKSDEYLLEELCEDIGLNNKIYSKHNFSSVEFYNKAIYKELLILGLKPQKAKDLNEKIIHTEYFNHFIRGLFDGDGTLGLYKKGNRKALTPKIAIYGYYPFLEKVQKYIPIKSLLYISNRGLGSISIHKKNDIIDFINWIYDNKNRFMKRKYDKAQELINYIINFKSQSTKKYNFYKNNRPYIKTICDNCDMEYLRRSDHIKLKHKFCSRECYFKWRKNNANS